MWCCKCNKHLSQCDCPDLEQRLETLKGASHVATRWCDVCGKYADRCQCKDGPTTKVVTAGVEYKQPPIVETDEWLRCPQCEAVWTKGVPGLRALCDCRCSCDPVPTEKPNFEEPAP